MKSHMAVVLSDSEFNITMYRQEEFWENNDVYLGPNIISLWSGTGCISYASGTLFQKPLVSLTKDEFRQEILHQLSKDRGFDEILKKSTGKTFSQISDNMVHFETWKNWKFSDSPGGEIEINEPKYVDSTNTRPYQPDTKTSLSNLWIAGGHTKTSTELWSMEAAASAGRKAADMITGFNSNIERNNGILLRGIRVVDDVLYHIGMSNVLDIIIYAVMIVFIILLLYIIIRIMFWIFASDRSINGNIKMLSSFLAHLRPINVT